nr:hypothetical protein [Tanacetum cinerariifolium]GEX92870.1 hypothetical protein [Tanacetum cinerariifolium]
GRLLIERLIPDEIEARLDWWVSSRAYFDGRISELERMPRHLNRQNHYEVPSEFYREFEEQKRVVDQMMKKDTEREKMYEQVRKFMQDMKVGPVPQANKGLIIGGSSSFPTANNSFFEDAIAFGYPKLATPYPVASWNEGKNANVSPLNLGNDFADDNAGEDKVMIMVERATGNYFVHENDDRGRQLSIMNLAHEFNDACTTKEDLWKAYEECRDIPLEQRALIDIYLKIASELDYEMHNALLWQAAKLEK